MGGGQRTVMNTAVKERGYDPTGWERVGGPVAMRPNFYGRWTGRPR